jgi:hypothetical protein
MTTTAERLRHLVDYIPATGLFLYRNRFHKKFNGTVIETRPCGGYLRIKIDGTLFAAHRLAWLYMTGEWPVDTIDHIDLDKSNNQWTNLREATRSENKANSRKRKDSTNPHKGVSWRPRQKKWQATVTRAGQRHHLGYFLTACEASAAYERAAVGLYGEFARAS